MTVADWLGFIGAVLTFVSVIISAYLTLRKVGEVHSLVNQQHTDLENRNITLVNALTDADVPVPPREVKEGTEQ